MKHFKSILLGAGMAAILFSACSKNEPKLTASGLNPAAFDTVINEKPVALYTLKNANGMEVCITNFGGRIVSIVVPDKDNNPQDVVLGFDNIKQYADIENSPSDFGAAIGRYANRIKNGKINIDGKEIQLPQNNFGHCLHGGPTGWQYQVYEAQQPDERTLQLTMKSPDGDNNFPGNVTAVVTYQLKDDNSIDIGYVGKIKKINTKVISMLANDEYIPVIAPIGVGKNGESYNINADTVAAEVAVALGASKLITLTDVGGVLRKLEDGSDYIIPVLDEKDIKDLVEEGIIKGGMIPKIEGCLDTVLRGVDRAHIIDGRIPHSIILETFTKNGIGTMIVKEKKEHYEYRK